MSTVSRLQAAAVSEARLQDEITAAFARELEQTLLLLNKLIRRLLRELETDRGRLVSTSANLGHALAMRQALIDLLEQSGVIALSRTALDAPLDRMVGRIFASFPIAGDAAALTPFDVDAIGALKELRIAALLDLDAKAATTVWRAVVDGVLGARPVEQLIQDIEDVLDKSAAEARTIYDTAVSTFFRQVDQLHTTQEPEELFIYVGPADKKTRPFCRTHVGKVYSRAEIETMDNGQLPNVLLTGGGYNCRHAWKRVSILDDELRQLHESGKRQDHIEQQLAGVAA